MGQTISAIIVSRNDNYGGNLVERATYCFNSAIDTYDEVIYVDWNSPDQSLFYETLPNLKTKGNFKHFVITPDVASFLTKHDKDAQKCCEVLGRNIGLRRATSEWLVSTNIDIIHPNRDNLLEKIKNSDRNTFYTVSRRHTDWDVIRGFHGGVLQYNQWEELRGFLIENSTERVYTEKTCNGDDYRIINCCGDFQMATTEIWYSIRGFEEDLIYALYADTNVQKKAVMHGFNLKAIYDPALFHIDHGKGGGGFLTGVNKKTNDFYRAIIGQEKTMNSENWGLADTDIEYEVF